MGEMTTFASGETTVTLWDMYVRAAQFMYGNDIEVVKTADITNDLNKLCFTVSVHSSDQQVIQRTKTVADITCKEYINNSDKEIDETLIKVKKNYNAGNQYQFTPSNGVNWGVTGNIGATVMGLAMSGGIALVGPTYTNGQGNEEFTSLNFSYEHEEKIKIPPLSKVKVRVTTNAIKYEQGYTLRLGVPASYSLPVTYKTSCDQMCCGSSRGAITASQLLRTLPSFQEQYGMARFYQHGVLSWLGEEKNVQKDVEQLQSMDLMQ